LKVDTMKIREIPLITEEIRERYKENIIVGREIKCKINSED